MYVSNGIELKSNIQFNLMLGQMNQLFYFELAEFFSFLGYYTNNYYRKTLFYFELTKEITYPILTVDENHTVLIIASV